MRLVKTSCITIAWVAWAALLLVACDGDTPVLDANTLAPPGNRTPIDGIQCGSSEALVFHIHTYLAIFVSGQAKLLPAGIGIGAPLKIESGFVVGGSCFSWLHTHDQSGVIHIEAPDTRIFTLGNFFDVWGQPLSANQVGPAHGAVIAYKDGQPFGGDPATLPLLPDGVLQLDVGMPTVSPAPYDFPPGL